MVLLSHYNPYQNQRGIDLSKSRSLDKKIKQIVDSKTNQELTPKWVLTATGTTITPASISNSGVMYSCDSIAVGSGNQARVGRQAFVKFLQYNVNLYADSTDVINVFRIVIFRWNDNTTATASDLFTSSNYSTSYYNIDNIGTGKLIVLYDQSFCTGTTSSGAKHLSIKLKLNKNAQWNSDAAVPAINGAHYVFVVSDSTAIPTPVIAGNITLKLLQ